MSDAQTSDFHSTGPSDRIGAESAIDPELLELPDPPRRDRTMTVALLVFTAFASLAMVLALRRDAAYSFAPPQPIDIGDLGSVGVTGLVENQYVEASVMLGASQAIRYERPLVSGSFRLMPVAGRDSVWAEVRVPPRGENLRWVPPSRVSGRLVRFDAAGPRHRGLASAVHEATGRDVPEGAWLLVDGAAPADARWAVMLVGMFAAFAGWNVLATAKLLRKVKR